MNKKMNQGMNKKWIKEWIRNQWMSSKQIDDSWDWLQKKKVAHSNSCSIKYKCLLLMGMMNSTHNIQWIIYHENTQLTDAFCYPIVFDSGRLLYIDAFFSLKWHHDKKSVSSPILWSSFVDMKPMKKTQKNGKGKHSIALKQTLRHEVEVNVECQ